jgi:hypothetical protein
MSTLEPLFAQMALATAMRDRLQNTELGLEEALGSVQ